MEEQSYDEIDDLFRQIRLQLIEIRESSPKAVEEIKSSLTQLEDWVEKLVIDSLRLKSLQSEPKKAAAAAKRSTKAPARRSPAKKPE